ncbi:MAG: hypothetical protein JF595_05270 [Sphingomonadales bacterium]|nr:hypothetical protein [Sphingomonadales bacterium]
MSIGTVARYRRRFFGRDREFISGSLVLDLHRLARRAKGEDWAEPHKTRLFPEL